MIAWLDVYNIFVAMTPLYVPLVLGYSSIKRLRMFNSDQCDAINRFNCYFVTPFFTFQFISQVDPYSMNFRFLGGDIVAKSMAGLALLLWSNVCKKGDFAWAITSFSLSSFNNTLVVGVPLLKAMYGVVGEDLVIQSSVIQALVWFPILLFLLEYRRASSSTVVPSEEIDDGDVSTNGVLEIVTVVAGDHQGNGGGDGVNREGAENDRRDVVRSSPPAYVGFGSTMKKVCLKLAVNPNIYACVIGLLWTLLAKRWNLKMPNIVEGSITIMAKAGSGVAMFTLGLFMALQEKVIACGVRLTFYGMVLRFVGGPLATAVGCVAFGLRANVLRIAIIQAALPQAINSFVFAKEYGLHADVLGTTVIFGTIISLPLLVGYYVVLDVLR